MPYGQLELEVLSPDLCAGCGLCVATCPESILSMKGVKAHMLNPDRAVACGDCVICHTVCPGADPMTELEELRLFNRQRLIAERWLGIYRGVYAGYANDSTIFDQSASGGSVTALLLAAMNIMKLDAVLAVGRDPDRPGHAMGRLCRSKAELCDACQSSYQLFPYLEILRDLLYGREKQRIALVGLPCHTQAIRKLTSLPSDLGRSARDCIVFIVEIACSSNTLPAGTDALLRREAGFGLDEVRLLRYRHGTYPGVVHVVSKSGDSVSIPFWKAVKEFKNHKTHRCLSCGDWFSGLSDIAVCDSDPNILKTSREGNHVGKIGNIIVRTQLGEEILHWTMAQEYLTAWPRGFGPMNWGCERKRHRRIHYEETNSPIPAGPFKGFVDLADVISDEHFI